MKSKLEFLDLGCLDYSEVEERQRYFAKQFELSDNSRDILLVADHPPTLTIGKNKRWNVVHKKLEDFNALGIQVYEAHRGGGAAILGPGQIAFYPILNLRKLGINQFEFFRRVNEAILGLSNRLGVNEGETFLGNEFNPATKRNYHCVWHQNGKGKKKFSAQGYKIKLSGLVCLGGWTVYFGQEATKGFDLIDHCGFNISKVGATSLEEIIGINFGRQKVRDLMVDEFSKIMGYRSYEESS